ncbi:uncharacterized protein [Montipora foliosa]|uniref:uncharacterized protein n=1 Tax=Montipora foliosa TaxID=591990 RepID=UPI0035F14EB8
MVGDAQLMAKVSSDESFYENVIVSKQVGAKRDINSNLEIEENETYRTMQGKLDSPTALPEHENVQDGENIYEMIPGDCAQQKFNQTPMIRSFSFGTAASRSSDGHILEASEKIERSNSCVSNLRVSSPLASQSSPDISSTHYAEIIHTNKVSDFVPSRPTRDSENPILRQDFSGNLSFLPNLRNLRKQLTEISQERCLDREQRSARTTPSHTPECPRRLNETVPDKCLSGSVSPGLSPEPSPRGKNPPGPIYVNMEFPFVENGENESRRSSGSSRSSVSCNEGLSLSSTEDAAFRETDLSSYENVRDVLECSKLKEKSSPVDIVYSDLHFHDSRLSFPRGSKLALESATPTNGLDNKLKVEETSRCLPVQPSPRLPPRGENVTHDPRQKSRSLEKLSGGVLGFYSARFVRGIVVQRSNAKALQTSIHDLVSKTKVEDCSSVNVEVTSDMMRISTNCPPWEVIASFDIENIGCIDLYEHETSTLGVIVCVPETDAHCYVIQCPDAQLIYSAVKNAFNSSNPKAFNVPISTPVGPGSWLGEKDVTTFSGISYLGSLKMKKTYLLINEGISSLLEKAHPKEFKTVFLEVQSENIRIIDGRDSKILHEHAIPWILKLGIYEEDPRLFGFIVSEARQGEKTRMLCHVFRCGRVTTSVAATEAIRLGCQATYSERRDSARANKRISFLSSSSNGSQECSGSPPSSDSSDVVFTEEVENKRDTNPENSKVKGKDPTKRHSLSLTRFVSIPRTIRSTSLPHAFHASSASKKDKESHTQGDTEKPHPTFERTTSVSSAGASDVADSSWEIVEEKEYNFDVTYLCSTVINPPLRPKHLRECVKQYQKQHAKAFKKFGVNPAKEVSLFVSIDGVKMTNKNAQKGEQEMFFPFSSVNHVMAHPENPEYFAFALVVTGDSKHKCHLFQQTKVPPGELIETFQSFM